ncbi:PLC-like phosphodiesterase [Phialemonium atrogriseum]|uniref:Phosphoinositide phospholipase C n=1 Tax=Phialemonium atrogriseum TaxID=1093897 RepID=A0AAJ0BYW3_9PEZI|nr:PLC-like phosphodiesterase [Phialemonium atrogriseum]KAK1765664.1 PLC-like phosphodiesterase [Phialemonium atrogriseum]
MRMAEITAETLPSPQVAAHQAGGGVSGQARAVKTINGPILAHLKRVYDSHAGKGDKAWDKGQVATFLRHVQGIDEDEISKQSLNQKDWDFNDFLRYMTSPSTNVIAPPDPKTQDLSWPLSSYFISSSHNTYLTGNQLYSESSTDAYKNVLLRGCRCIEIDVWDGEDLDSDSESGTSTSNSDEAHPKAHQKRKAKLERVKGKIPVSLVSRLEKTSLGRRLEQYVDRKAPNPASAPAPAVKKPEAAADPKVQANAPNAPGDIVEPRVLHGYTLTREVSFRDVCVAIRDDAFTASDLPLIVSLEVHCRAAQQEVMVKIMQETWKEFLLPEPKDEAQMLPAPADLRHKILVKVKYAPPSQAAGGTTPETGTGDSDEESLPTGAAPKAKKKPAKIIQALSQLGIYTRGVSFKGLTQPEATMPTHIFSLSENRVMDTHEKYAGALFDHNRDFLMRTYPSGLRIRSSNLDPVDFWSKGVQIVALNWQKWDEGMMLNEGMFAGTGGYVLKPEGYRSTHRPSHSSSTITATATATTTKATVPPHAKPLDLTITVLAAQSLPLPKGDTKADSFRPYIKAELHTEDPDRQRRRRRRHAARLYRATSSAFTPADEASDTKEGSGSGSGRHKARTPTGKGRDPDFGLSAALSFRGVVLPAGPLAAAAAELDPEEELSFVRFTIRDDEIGHDELAAWACVRLDRLGAGYRFVHLLDAGGVETEGLVLIRVSKGAVA